ncbi:LysM peptidoglycan-binding domain-containing protein [Phototrophicus methaneseepsis]|uniref:LysM peptidoglycan-binding domain-containing protein n=1 Tax=Phototrophicus methaneseepsis TaxID=2710758 RepID=A0A7S8ID35_9CHLR|nr:LysM peptidoglycan-binding domain-containing protein [Phototrophicus methaneseepsis]QPC81136.1 LysM peptidoglycan-binding domain-containing protein [Phototrophicus methaneseepsis]
MKPSIRMQFILPLRLSLLLLSFLLFSFSVTTIQGQDNNLLTNPGFEDAFVARENEELLTVANGWEPWHMPHTADMPDYQNARPYYIGSTTANAMGILPRVRSGNQSQIYYSFYETHDGGIYQQISGIEPGTELRFSIYAHVWSTTYDDFNVSEDDGGVALRVGIDTSGGTDPDAASVVYSTPGIFYDTFRQYSVIATAESDTVTVFVRTTVADAVRNTVIYLDDAVLEVTPESGGSVTEEPTEEPTAVVTEEPTEAPTEEPTEVVTEEPTEQPTSTPLPTSTSTPLPTATTASSGGSDDPTPTQEDTGLVATATPVSAQPTATTASAQPTATETGDIEAPPDNGTTGPISQDFPGQIIHVVRRGETVGRIAALYGSTIEAIIQANGLDTNALIFINQALFVPVRIIPATIVPSPTPIATQPPENQAEVPTQPPSAPSGTNTYVVQPGDTLLRIASRFNTTVATLVQLNNIGNPNRIYYGQRLIVPAPVVTTPQPEPAAATYVVQRGDYLLKIAIRFNVSLNALVAANGLTNINRIYPGQVLTIPQS